MNNTMQPIKLPSDVKDTIKIINWNGYKIHVRYNIGHRDMVDFINSVLSACYDSENSIYTFGSKYFAIRVNVIMRYTSIELPDDLESQYKTVYDSNLYETILNNINQQQVQDIIDSIDMYLKVK